MNIEQLVSTDTRTPFQKLRHHQVTAILKKLGIAHDPTAPKDQLLKIAEGQGVTLDQCMDQFKTINVKDEKGNIRQELAAIVKPHHTAHRDIDYDQILSAKAEELIKERESEEMLDLKKQVTDLIALNEKTQAQLDQRIKQARSQKTLDSVPVSEMQHFQVRKVAASMGIRIKPTDKKADLIRMIEEVQNGKNA